MLGKLRPSKLSGDRAGIVFTRLTRFYGIFNVIATLIGSLSLAVLTFDEFHPTCSAVMAAAERLLCSSAVTAVVAVMLGTMLLFRYEGHEQPTRFDLAIAWTPLVLLDVSIVELLIGTVIWYGRKNRGWRAAIMSTQLAVLLGGTIVTASWMENTMSVAGGLGADEVKVEKKTPTQAKT